MLNTLIAKSLMSTSPKGLFTPSECGSKSEKDQTSSREDQIINDKDQRIFSLSLGVNGP